MSLLSSADVTGECDGLHAYKYIGLGLISYAMEVDLCDIYLQVHACTHDVTLKPEQTLDKCSIEYAIKRYDMTTSTPSL